MLERNHSTKVNTDPNVLAVTFTDKSLAYEFPCQRPHAGLKALVVTLFLPPAVVIQRRKASGCE